MASTGRRVRSQRASVHELLFPPFKRAIFLRIRRRSISQLRVRRYLLLLFRADRATNFAAGGCYQKRWTGSMAREIKRRPAGVGSDEVADLRRANAELQRRLNEAL